MVENVRLNRRQRRFVSALVTSPTIRAAARETGISETTAYRYLRNQAVKQVLSQELDDLLAQMTRRAVDEMGAALDTLVEIHKDKEQGGAQRVSAARVIFAESPKLREAYDLAERVAELEQREQEEGADGEY